MVAYQQFPIPNLSTFLTQVSTFIHLAIKLAQSYQTYPPLPQIVNTPLQQCVAVMKRSLEDTDSNEGQSSDTSQVIPHKHFPPQTFPPCDSFLSKSEDIDSNEGPAYTHKHYPPAMRFSQSLEDIDSNERQSLVGIVYIPWYTRRRTFPPYSNPLEPNEQPSILML